MLKNLLVFGTGFVASYLILSYMDTLKFSFDRAAEAYNRYHKILEKMESTTNEG